MRTKKVIFTLVIIAIALLLILMRFQNNFYKVSIKNSSLTNQFAVYYGDSVNSSIINYLNKYKLVILEPWAFNSSLLNKIKAIKIAYIDLGEYDNSSLGNCTVNVSQIAIGYDSQWNQTVVNVSSPIWERYIVCEVNYSLKEGFQGVLFDDVDDAEIYNLSQGMINIIIGIRKMYPNIIIGINRGFFILPNVSKYINFVLYEDYGTVVSGIDEVKFVSNVSEIISRTEYIKSLNITIYALSYAVNKYDKYYNYSILLAIKNDVPIYISNWNVSATW
ncbi:hypothetical protein [Caldisphaera sp.]|uniref:hypothetical protein n=1 Tax=Caldisphaera sp. TaxID=2060322 RepID=UPI0025C216DF|nr:hypothetical protein [Caldisphaera sp.]